MLIALFQYILFGLASAFFLTWGVTLFLSAYSLANPLEFIVLFFSSNFIILISGIGVLHAGVRLWKLHKESSRRHESTM